MVLVVSVALVLFAATPDLFTAGLLLGAVAPPLLIVLDGGFPDKRLRRAILSMAVLLGLIALLLYLLYLMWGYAISLLALQPAIAVTLFLGALPLAFFWRPTAPRGSLALLSALVLAPLLALGLMVDGEVLETYTVKTQKPFLTWRMLSHWLASREWSVPGAGRQYQALAKQFAQNDRISIGHTVLSCVILAEQRRLDLNEQALFAKPLNPELLAALRAGKGLENKDKLERISLADRSLRRTSMRKALLVGADLRGAQLQGADLTWARLQGANLRLAQLQGADLSQAQLEGADLAGAWLQGANLSQAELQGARLGWAELQGARLGWAQLQGADLADARLQGANLADAWLQGADLSRAQLQGANLSRARLQGANLGKAQLEGANLGKAQLEGANLAGAQLQGADLQDSTFYRNGNPAQSDLLDVRGAAVMPLSHEVFSKLQAMLKPIPFAGQERSLQRLEAAAKPGAEAPTFASCLTDEKSQPRCQQSYAATNLDQHREFMVRLHEVLATLSCEGTDIARGILRQIPDPYDRDSSRAGLATVLLARMKANEPCPGLAGLSSEDKTKLERLAKQEAEREQPANASRAASTRRPRR